MLVYADVSNTAVKGDGGEGVVRGQGQSSVNPTQIEGRGQVQ